MSNNQLNSVAYLSFLLNGELFAFEVKKVIEVLEYQKITPIPKSKPHIKGVINFRGDILPVIETRIKFNLEELKPTESSVIIVLDICQSETEKNIQVGTIADAVRDVVYVKAAHIMAVPELNSKLDTSLTEGIFKYNEKFVTILNIEKIFSLEK